MTKASVVTMWVLCLQGTVACGGDESGEFTSSHAGTSGTAGASTGGKAGAGRAGSSSSQAGSSAASGGSSAGKGGSSAGKGGSSAGKGSGASAGGGAGGSAGDAGAAGTIGVAGDSGASGESSGGMSPGGSTGSGGEAGATSPEPQDPVVTINHPGDGEMRGAGDDIPFVGVATDPQDGTLTGASLVWTSSLLSNPIGTGTNLTESLAAGTHVITLTATDSDSNVGTDSITLVVE